MFEKSLGAKRAHLHPQCVGPHRVSRDTRGQGRVDALALDPATTSSRRPAAASGERIYRNLAANAFSG